MDSHPEQAADETPVSQRTGQLCGNPAARGRRGSAVGWEAGWGIHSRACGKAEMRGFDLKFCKIFSALPQVC
jgi:hypothetical protein